MSDSKIIESVRKDLTYIDVICRHSAFGAIVSHELAESIHLAVGKKDANPISGEAWAVKDNHRDRVIQMGEKCHLTIGDEIKVVKIWSDSAVIPEDCDPKEFEKEVFGF